MSRGSPSPAGSKEIPILAPEHAGCQLLLSPMRKPIFRSVEFLHLRHVTTIITLMKPPPLACSPVEPSPLMEGCLSGIICGTRRQHLAAGLPPRDERIGARATLRSANKCSKSLAGTRGDEEKVIDLNCRVRRGGKGLRQPPAWFDEGSQEAQHGCCRRSSAAPLQVSAQRFLHIKPSSLTPLRKGQPQILAPPPLSSRTERWSGQHFQTPASASALHQLCCYL